LAQLTTGGCRLVLSSGADFANGQLMLSVVQGVLEKGTLGYKVINNIGDL